MEKNLCVPILMVVAFVAILASLFAGPLTEDDGPVIGAYVGEELQFGYVSYQKMSIVSDGSVEIYQYLHPLTYDASHLQQFTVFMKPHEVGQHSVYIYDGTDVQLMFLTLAVSTAIFPLPDGSRDISSELEPVFETHGICVKLEDPPISGKTWWGDFVDEVDKVIKIIDLSSEEHPDLPSSSQELPAEEGWAYQVYRISVKFSEDTDYNTLPYTNQFHMKECPDVYAVDVDYSPASVMFDVICSPASVTLTERDQGAIVDGPGPHEFYIAFLVPEGTEHGLINGDDEQETPAPGPSVFVL